MKKIALVFSIIISEFSVFAQNVGIGTLTPAYPLHIFNTTSSELMVESSNSSLVASQFLKVPGGLYNQLFLHKWGASASGNQSGIPLANLSQVMAGANANALMLGTVAAAPVHVMTNNLQRIHLDENGYTSFNTLGKQGRVSAYENIANKATIFAFHENGTESNAVMGQIKSPMGAAVTGIAFQSNITSPYEINNYGVLGRTGAAGVAVGAFSVGGTGIRAAARDGGLALSTSGNIRFDTIGEAAGRILTSDAAGNATWQDASASSGWSKNIDGDIYNNPNNAVLIGINAKSPSMSVYNMPIGLQVYNKKSTFFDNTGGDGTLKIINGGSFTDEPLEAATAFYIKSPLGTAAIIDTRYTGVEVVSTAQNTNWAAGRFILNNTTSSANAFEINNNSNGYALVVNNRGADSNASGYFSNSNTSYTANSNINLELNNGYLKVSGIARTSFVAEATLTNTDTHMVHLNYDGMAATDMVYVNHRFVGSQLIGGLGVWWNSNRWTIFRENQQAIPIGEKFNVLVIKQ
jgi:hypothetical protein